MNLIHSGVSAVFPHESCLPFQPCDKFIVHVQNTKVHSPLANGFVAQTIGMLLNHMDYNVSSQGVSKIHHWAVCDVHIKLGDVILLYKLHDANL